MLKIVDGSKSYDQVVWKNVNINFEKNKVYVISGESGSGKTTLLNILANFEQLDDGQVFLGDQIYQKPFSNNKLYRKDISIVFQDYALINNQTVLDNLLIALEYVNLSNKEKKELIIEELIKIGLANLENKKVATLSGGQRQRVGLLRAKIKPSKVILLDEPTGNLDQKNVQLIKDLITELAVDHTIIVITHDLSYLEIADFHLEIKDQSINNQNIDINNEPLK